MNINKTLADVQPGGRVRLGDQRSDLVPGIVRCAKCAFQLHRTNLYLQSGTVGAGDSKTEPCPNGCGPLWPVTWETWAREGWTEAERLHLENVALSAQPSPAGQGDALAAINRVVEQLEDMERGCRIHPDYLDDARVAQAALAARQPVGEPVTVEAVATVRRWSNGDRYIDWLTEGGIADLEVGDVLMVSDRAITDEDGSGEVYTAPPAQAVGTQPLGCAECPVTGLPFYGNMEHPERGMIAMYGGPLDVFSIPELQDNDGELRRERYDLDADCWVEGGEPLGYFYREQQPDNAAQAVDLGQFRPAVCAMGLYAEEPEDVDEAKRLLALIDSQALGNG